MTTQSDTISESKIAAAILLIAIVKADGHIDRLEIAEVIDIFTRKYHLPADEVGNLLEQASDPRDHSYDLNAFTEQLSKTWDHPHRLDLLQYFWEIAIADSDIDDRESSLIEQLAGLLNLQTDEIRRARRAAEQNLPRH